MVRMGFLLYLGNTPLRILLTTAWPRIILRVVFWVLVGQFANGPAGAEFLYVGLTALSLTHAGIVSMSDVTIEDKWMGTYSRLLGGLVSPRRVFFARAGAHWAASLVELFLAALAAGLLTGQGGLMLDLAALLPIYLVISLSCSAAGLACASVCVGKRAEVALYNGLATLIDLSSGAMIPTGKIAPLEAIGEFLPVTHGVSALRSALAGKSWAGELSLEIAVLGGWLVLASLLFAGQTRRSRRTGYDAYS